MSCNKYTLVRTWGRVEGTPKIDNIEKRNNVKDTGLTEIQRQKQLLKNMDNTKIINNLGYCKCPSK